MNYIETLRLDDNVVQNVGYHTARMGQNTTAILPSLQALNPHTQGRVKCRVVYTPTEIISIEFMPYRLPVISSLKIVEDSAVVYDRKYLDRSALNELYSKRGDCDDILICKGGVITDSYFCNVLFKRGERLFTPNSPLLAGTKRQRLIDEGIITPCTIYSGDVASYDAAYLINAMIDISDNICIPVTRIYK